MVKQSELFINFLNNRGQLSEEQQIDYDKFHSKNERELSKGTYKRIPEYKEQQKRFTEREKSILKHREEFRKKIGKIAEAKTVNKRILKPEKRVTIKVKSIERPGSILNQNNSMFFKGVNR